VTAAFDALELNIIEARLQLSSSGFALYSFNATVPEADSATKQDYMSFLEERLRTLILEKESDKAISRRSASRVLKYFPIQPRVIFSFGNPSYTAMEVIAQDQPGLLHNVARVLAQHNIILISAKVSTFGERADDIFYIRRHDHSPVVDELVLNDVRSKICEALDRAPTSKKKVTAA